VEAGFGERKNPREVILGAGAGGGGQWGRVRAAAWLARALQLAPGGSPPSGRRQRGP